MAVVLLVVEFEGFECWSWESDVTEGSDDVAGPEMWEGNPREGCGESDALH